MSLISLEHINKSYFGRPVLTDLSLTVENGEHLALIGPNGAGKTTLFRLLAGQENCDPEAGRINRRKHLVMAHFEQQIPEFTQQLHSVYVDPLLGQLAAELDELRQKISAGTADANDLADYGNLESKFQQLGAYDYRHRLDEALAGLGLPPNISERPPESLSGGEKMRVQLARLLLQDLDLLLLDEPTNHLDADAIEWLEGYLQNFKGAFIVISHDRQFLDNVADNTLELMAGRLYRYKGNYSAFKAQKAERAEMLEREISKLDKIIADEEEVVQTMLSHRKMSSYHSREKKLERYREEREALVLARPQNEQRLKMVVGRQAATHKDRILFNAERLSWTFPDSDRPLFHDLKFCWSSRDRIALVGPNGAGKSTLLKALLGDEQYLSGQLERAPQMHTAYLGQLIHFEHPERTLLQEFQLRQPTYTEDRARKHLAAFGFTGTGVFKKIEVLSGGERSRLYLSFLLLEDPEVLFLDEPTNHLDIHSREILEAALRAYEGCLITVSHDRYFLEQIDCSIWALENGQLQTFRNYAQYRRARENARSGKGPGPSSNDGGSKRGNAAEASAASPSTSNGHANGSGEAQAKAQPLWSESACQAFPDLQKVLYFPQNRAQERRFRALLQAVSKSVEQRHAAAETEAQALEARFASADGPAVYEEYARLQAEMEELDELYFALLEQLELTENSDD